MDAQSLPITASAPARVLVAGDRFAIPAGAALVEAAAALRRAALPDAPVDELRAAARTAGEAWVDTILDGFVLALAAAARGRAAGRRTASTIRDLADTIVGSGTRRLDAVHADGFIAFLDAHVADGPAATIVFPLEPALAEALTPALAADVPPPVLARALHATVDATLTNFLDAPLALLGLGLVVRTGVRIGRAAVASRVRGEIERAVRDPAAAARLQAMLLGYVAG
ncbi:MAG: hypothetical protein IPL61_33945 [Myxococcales bacterium]|nr:hypothetical protein [Myxococcales bacterium]